MNMTAFTIAFALLAIIFGGWLYICRSESLLGVICGFCGVCAVAAIGVIWIVDALIGAL